jgi:hypothetical protein
MLAASSKKGRTTAQCPTGHCAELALCPLKLVVVEMNPIRPTSEGFSLFKTQLLEMPTGLIT